MSAGLKADEKCSNCDSMKNRNSFFKNSAIMDITMQVSAFCLFDNVPSYIAKMVAGFGLAISKLQENNIFKVPNGFLNVVL